MTDNKPKLTSIIFICENFDQVKIPIQAIEKLRIDNVHTEQTYEFERYDKNEKPNYTNDVDKYCETFYLEYSIDTADKLTAKDHLFEGSGTRLVTYPDAVDMFLNFDDQSQEHINLPYYSDFNNENEWQKNKFKNDCTDVKAEPEIQSYAEHLCNDYDCFGVRTADGNLDVRCRSAGR